LASFESREVPDGANSRGELKRDLELLHLPDGTLNEFAPPARRA